MAGEQVPGPRDLGRLGQLPAVDPGAVSRTDARWCPRDPVPRIKAAELGIDPDRIAACGNSAGAGISLWVGFHDDLADPTSDDPVSRQSSRLACMGVVGAQTSYDPRFIKQLIGGRAHEHVALKPLFGVTTDDQADSPQVHQLYEQSSPLN